MRRTISIITRPKPRATITPTTAAMMVPLFDDFGDAAEALLEPGVLDEAVGELAVASVSVSTREVVRKPLVKAVGEEFVEDGAIEGSFGSNVPSSDVAGATELDEIGAGVGAEAPASTPGVRVSMMRSMVWGKGESSEVEPLPVCSVGVGVSPMGRSMLSVMDATVGSTWVMVLSLRSGSSVAESLVVGGGGSTPSGGLLNIVVLIVLVSVGINTTLSDVTSVVVVMIPVGLPLSLRKVSMVPVSGVTVVEVLVLGLSIPIEVCSGRSVIPAGAGVTIVNALKGSRVSETPVSSVDEEGNSVFVAVGTLSF